MSLLQEHTDAYECRIDALIEAVRSLAEDMDGYDGDPFIEARRRLRDAHDSLRYAKVLLEPRTK